MTTAATDPSRMVILVTTITVPPVFNSSKSSFIGGCITRGEPCFLPHKTVVTAGMPTWTELALECAKFARQGLNLPDDASPVAVVLGSGLGAFADQLRQAHALSFSALPGFPRATVQGHKGRLVFGRLDDTPILALQGRLHGYEGHDAATVAYPARVLSALGARALVVTNAAGGVNASFAPGDLMRITDHINLTGKNPLIGPNEDALGPRFPDMSHAYDARLAEALETAAMRLGQKLRAGVYLQMSGRSDTT